MAALFQVNEKLHSLVPAQPNKPASQSSTLAVIVKVKVKTIKSGEVAI
jgi:hypothetical protein